ncbi:SIS domain-containing protein [Alteriqipengyuania lutimaris]|uniref:SIS domain-containing protein n=1 Tax=Alteriqipengyuania lutimaris TaxID=1538146 RepID=A0A395LGH5_9SPHN|nr:SIS domain-containing protein [Alteriqipengyuania lutimaris]MBB3035422.1 fructoselysine-6-P-deglycase FrlB-like protein [Alteriqipengyuania lutimaris]RDS75998.1 SIS domain-containing protein [Alteriqipengyuania lutimaris]
MSATHAASSQMLREAAEAPRRAAWQRDRNRDALREAARRIRALDPPFAITIAQGSSDRAASFEAAQKLKEVTRIHAEAFSSADVAHGPMALIGEGDPVFAFASRRRCTGRFPGSARIAARAGAHILWAGSADTCSLPAIRSRDPGVEATGMILSFYRLVEALAHRRGLDPDHPPHLSKITRTR